MKSLRSKLHPQLKQQSANEGIFLKEFNGSSGVLSKMSSSKLWKMSEKMTECQGITQVGDGQDTETNRHHYVDLVFYHRILKCFVLIDLKIDEAGYEDIGQMNMYLSYFENEENVEDDNPPIGIVLARSKDELLVKYALYHVTSQLFVSKYQLYLPNREELKQLFMKRLEGEEQLI